MSVQLFIHNAWPDAESSHDRVVCDAYPQAEVESGYLATQLLPGREVPVGGSVGGGLWRWLGNCAGEVVVLARVMLGRGRGRRREAVAVSLETATASAYPCACVSSSSLR